MPRFVSWIGDWTTALGGQRCATNQKPAPGGVGPPAPLGFSVAKIQGFECIFQVLINLAISAIALAALVAFISGGFKLLTAGGDGKKASEASQTITLGVTGVAVAIGAWFILRLVGQFTGTESIITNFVIPGP